MVSLHLTKKKFRDFKENELIVIQKKLNSVAYSVGIREPLQDVECIVLANFIKNEFQDFSVSELDLIADKYSAGKLTFTDSHYQVFSKDFLGKLLKSYRIYRNKEMIKFHKEKAEIEERENPTTEEEKKKIHIEFLNKVIYEPYLKCLKNETYLVLEDDIAFGMFVKMYKGGVLNPSNEEINHFRVLACEKLSKPLTATLNKKQIKGINQLMSKLKLVLNDNGDKETTKIVKEKSASLYFNNWINKQIENKIDIKEIIK